MQANKISKFNPVGINLQVVQADGSQTPTSSVDLGQDIKLRVVYNKNLVGIGKVYTRKILICSFELQVYIQTWVH